MNSSNGLMTLASKVADSAERVGLAEQVALAERVDLAEEVGSAAREGLGAGGPVVRGRSSVGAVLISIIRTDRSTTGSEIRFSMQLPTR